MGRPRSARDELRDLIETSGLTRKEVAQAIGVTRRVVDYWLKPGEARTPPQWAAMALRWHLYRYAAD